VWSSGRKEKGLRPAPEGRKNTWWLGDAGTREVYGGRWEGRKPCGFFQRKPRHGVKARKRRRFGLT